MDKRTDGSKYAEKCIVVPMYGEQSVGAIIHHFAV